MKIRRTIEKELGPGEIFALINTQGHGDHTYGNQVFRDVPIIAHSSVVATIVDAEGRRAQTAAKLEMVLARLEDRLDGVEADSAGSEQLQAKIRYYEAMHLGLTDGFVLTPPTRPTSAGGSYSPASSRLRTWIALSKVGSISSALR